MRRRVWTGAVLVLAFLAVPASGQVKLQWNLKEGDKFYVETVSNQKQVMEFMGQRLPMNMATTQLMSFSVLKKAADGGMTLQQKFEHVHVKAEGQMAAGQQQMAEKIKGAVFTVTLDKSGKITKLDGFEAYVQKIVGNDAQMAKMIRAMLNEDSVTQMFQDIFAFVPDKPVSKGDTWKRDSSLSLGPMGKFKITQEYTYVGPAKDGEEVSVKSTFTYEAGKGGGALPFQITKGNFKSTDAKGTFIFDTKAGRLVRSSMAAKLDGALTMSAGGQEIDMKMEMEQDTKSRVLDKVP